MIYRIILLSLFLVSCVKNGGDDNTPSPPILPPKNSPNLSVYLGATGANVMPVSVSGSLCGSNKYTNMPCVKIRLCEPGTSNCQDIDNILLDTGSYGLRVFKSLITLDLPEVKNGLIPYGTCATFGTGAMWGSVHRSDIILGDLSLGGEKAPDIPLQLVDKDYSNYSSNCSNGEVDESPTDAYYNGILGIGQFVQDCGTGCTTNTNNNIYFTCTGTTCSKSTIPLNKQVANPINYLPTNNNGSILALPDVSSIGSSSVSGVLILGVGTSTNNAPDDDMYFFQASSTTGYIKSTYKGRTTRALFDSGTNAYAFYDNTLVNCSGSSYYCPSSLLNLSVNQEGFNLISVNFDFMVEHPGNIFIGGKYVFNNIAFEISHSHNFFIYGLPFHLGKAIFMGIDGKSSSLGSGMYWAY